MKTARLLLIITIVVLLSSTLACIPGAQPPPAQTSAPTSAPSSVPTPQPTAALKIGGRIFGVECQPSVLNILHGQVGEIKVVDVEGAGKVTEF